MRRVEEIRHRGPRKPKPPAPLREVTLDDLPRQPRYTGSYEIDVDRFLAILSPETRRAVSGAWELGGREFRPSTLVNIAQTVDANVDCVLLWCGYARISRNKYAPADEAATALIDRYDTESLALFRLFQLHWPDFRTRAVLTGAQV